MVKFQKIAGTKKIFQNRRNVHPDDGLLFVVFLRVILGIPLVTLPKPFVFRFCVFLGGLPERLKGHGFI